MPRMRTFVVALTLLVAATSAQSQPLLLTGAENPYKMDHTPGGNLLLTEAGLGANDGRVNLVTGWGARYNLLDGLPSAITNEEDVIGPTAVVDAHRTLYVILGDGDVLGEAPPGTHVPNPDGLSSAIFSSVLRARFDPVPDGIRSGFTLGPETLQALADGREVELVNDAGERVELLLLTDFRDLVPDPVLGVRQSNPFAATHVGSLTQADLEELGFDHLDVHQANFHARLHPETPLGRRLVERSALYVVDAGMNTVIEVSAATGRWHVLTRLPPVSNDLFPDLGGPVAEAVPTGIRSTADGDLLVTTFSGFPFVPGSAKVYSVDVDTGDFSPWIEELSGVTDVLRVGGATYVLELSTDLLAGAPGRLLRFDAPDAAPVVVAEGLIGASGMSYDPARHEIVVSETFTGSLKRIALEP